MAKKAMRKRERNLKAKREAEQQRLKREMLEAEKTEKSKQHHRPVGISPMVQIPGEQLADFTKIESPALSTAYSLMALNQQKPNLEQALEIQKSVEAEIEKFKKDDKSAYSERLYGQVLVLDQLFHSLVQEAAQQPNIKQFNAILDKAQACQERCLKTIATLNKVRTKVPSQRTEYIKDVVLRFILEIQDENGFAKWEGTATELLAVLTDIAPPEIRQSTFWPKSYVSLGMQIKKLAPELEQVGIGYKARKLTTKNQPNIITLEQTPIELVTNEDAQC
ncbi:hypothetical protein [Acaryochloris sp. IP29b_bin.148]|uniref:hypothetical protein n=1 Tax=Acaryochloris sp. IP29b_bin.148 TaxID=2969218 RepID=UPI00262E48EE|nr:hypothetical protein [Acaryochloris sp. IP29b_bin.148]